MKRLFLILACSLVNDYMEGPVIINNGKTRLKARYSVTIHDSFEVTKGSEFIIEGD